MSIHADILHITNTMDTIISKLDAELLKLQAVGAAKEVNTSEELTTEDRYQSTTVALQDDSGQKMDAEDGRDGHSAKPFPDVQNESHLTPSSSDCNGLKENAEGLVQSGEEMNSFSPHSVNEGAEGVEGKKEKNSKWLIVG